MTSSLVWLDVSSNGAIGCQITEVFQALDKNITLVRIDGLLQNQSTDVLQHQAQNIGCWITGDLIFQGPYFNIYILPVKFSPNNVQTFITGYAYVIHDSDGNRTVNFTVKYGKTGMLSFPDDQSVSGTLVLDRIPVRPGKPGQPQFSNEAPTTLSVSWTAPTDDGGSGITNYILRRYDGTDTSGNHLDSSGDTLSRNLTNLVPGATYTFTVVSINGSQGPANGISLESNPNTITTTSGGYVRFNGAWIKAIPYVRQLGQWKQALPYVRDNGIWKKT